MATLEEEDEFNFLLEKTRTYAHVTSVCPLQSHKAWLGYTTVYKPSVTYPLSAISLDNNQFSGCMRLTHLKAHQMSAKLCGTMKHIQAGTKTGNKCLSMVRWAQVSAGTGVPILEETGHLHYLEGK
eukprot:2217730-Ditylum_brightwellii.AAC.1